jgi:hypothetical protein
MMSVNLAMQTLQMQVPFSNVVEGGNRELEYQKDIAISVSMDFVYENNDLPRQETCLYDLCDRQGTYIFPGLKSTGKLCELHRMSGMVVYGLNEQEANFDLLEKTMLENEDPKTKKKRGPKPIEKDYKAKYESERQKCAYWRKKYNEVQASLQPLADEVKPLANKVQKLEAAVVRKKRIIQKYKQRCYRLKNKVSKGSRKSKKSYKEMANRTRRRHRAFVASILSNEAAMNCKEAADNMAQLALDITRSQKGTVLKNIFADDSICNTFKEQIVKPQHKKTLKNQTKRSRNFLNRKLSFMGRERKKKLDALSSDINFQMADGVEVPNVIFPEHGDRDNKAREHLRVNFPCLLPIAETDSTINVEHAFVDAEAMVRAAIVFLYTTPAMHKHIVWFWDDVLQRLKINHFELMTFYDGYPLFSGKENATLFAFRFLNLASFVHVPQFGFLLFVVKAKEQAGACVKLLRRIGDKLCDILSSGLSISFDGYDPNCKVPGSDVPLNGVHHITFGKNLFSGDAKATLFSQGCFSASQSFLPFFCIHSENFANPDYPVTMDTFIPFAMRVQKFLSIEDIRVKQKDKYVQEVLEIRKNKNLKEAEIAKKTANAWNRLVKKVISQQAIKLKTGCVHLQPFKIADLCAVCGLHMECNEILRVLQKVIDVCAELTLCHNLASSFEKKKGLSDSSLCKLPHIGTAHKDSPLARAVSILHSINLPSVATHFFNFYTPVSSEHEAEQDLKDDAAETVQVLQFEDAPNAATPLAEKDATNSRLRLLGSHAKIICANLPKLVDCVRPAVEGLWPDGSAESDEEKRQHMILWTYAHLTISLCSLYSCWLIKINFDEVGASFLGELFVRLVHRFALHKSCNTFLFIQVAPFLMQSLIRKYQLNSELALGMGIYARNEGGELKNQVTKKQISVWISRRPGSFCSLLDQCMEVYLGGMHMFPGTIPFAEHIHNCTRDMGTARRQRFAASQPNLCSCCRSHPTQGYLHDFLSNCDELQCNKYKNIQERTASTFFKGLSLHTLFQFFFHVDISENMMICSECAKMTQFCVALWFGEQNKLSWV